MYGIFIVLSNCSQLIYMQLLLMYIYTLTLWFLINIFYQIYLGSIFFNFLGGFLWYMHVCPSVYGVCGTLPEVDFQGHSHCFPSFLRHFTELGAISASLASQKLLEHTFLCPTWFLWKSSQYSLCYVFQSMLVFIQYLQVLAKEF